MNVLKNCLGIAVAASLVGGCVAAWERPRDLHCDSDSQCGAGERCLAWASQNGCYGNSCQASCVPETACNDETDCGDGEICSDYHCVEACKSDADCSPYTCMVASGECRRACSSDYLGTGSADDPDVACVPGANCTDSYSGECEISDCGGDPAVVCGAYACRGTACLTECYVDYDCGAGYLCSNFECTDGRAPGDYCEVSEECSSGVCDNYACADPCADRCGTVGDVDCGFCTDNADTCSADNYCLLKEGYDCYQATDCASGVCCATYDSAYYTVCAASAADCY